MIAMLKKPGDKKPFFNHGTHGKLGAGSAHNPFFNNERHENFIGVAALTDEMALRFAVWLVVLSDRSSN